MAAIMRGLEAEKYDRQYSDRALVSRIAHYFRPYPGRAALVVVSVAAVALLGAATPLVISQGIRAMDTAEAGRQLLWLVAAVFLAGVLTWALNWVRRLNTVIVVQDVVQALRVDAFNSAARQDLSFYDRYSSGRIVSRITSDTDEFGRVVELVFDLVQQISTALFLIALLFTINWQLTLLMLAMSPLVVFASLAFRNAARRATRQGSRVLGEVNRSIQEAVTGIAVAKNFRQEQAIYGEFQEVNAQSYRINLRRGLVLAAIFPTLNVLLGIGTGTLVYFGGRATLSGAIAIASWYLFIATVDRFWFPLLNMSSFWSQFQQGLSSAERIFALIDAQSEIVQTGQLQRPIAHGAIVFERVSFGYTQDQPILRDFSLTIQPGETVALVGHTGAGKSSIIKLVSRFYEFQSGRLLIDDVDIRDYDLAAYRAQLGIVSQTPFLFDGTVADNIRYGRPQTTDAEILAMARRIGRGEWLETLPDGLQTQVGERGNRLSMGQRQLVALTRVLVTDPRIFILDEATANIDPFTEAQIQEALALIMQDRTSIVIAHRLSTIRSADRIIVLQNGATIEEGSHTALMAAGRHYAELYNAYFRHQSLQYIESRSWMGG